MFKIRGKFWFLTKSLFDPPYMGSTDFKNHYIGGQNPKSSKVGGVTYQNLCEKGTKPMKETRAQSELPVWRKIPKTTQKYCFSEK